ncbi:MAG: hypothetical protein IJP92_01400 [Lachnospiraceae bacterium]|nr:hypothetical protein [Lachnospiraceae bacterium]
MAGRKKSSSGAVKYIILAVFVVLVVLGVFLMLTLNRGSKQSDEDSMVLTKVQTVTTLDLNTNYPNNERDVVNMYGRIMQTLYNETYEDADLDAMAAQLQVLYDNELLLNQPNYVMQLKQEVAQKKTDGFVIQNYVVPEKNDVTFFTQDGRECAGMDVQFSIRNATRLEATFYVFILRKEETTGRWKIFGWQPKEDQTFNLFGSEGAPAGTGGAAGTGGQTGGNNG